MLLIVAGDTMSTYEGWHSTVQSCRMCSLLLGDILSAGKGYRKFCKRVPFSYVSVLTTVLGYLLCLGSTEYHLHYHNHNKP